MVCVIHGTKYPNSPDKYDFLTIEGTEAEIDRIVELLKKNGID